MIAALSARKSLSSLYPRISSLYSGLYGYNSRRNFASSALDGVVRDVPITKVVLYKHGVGYFERRCTVENNQKVLLGFRNTDMNDMLKTVSVREETREGVPEGTITNIEYVGKYDSRLDPKKEMNDISINLTNGGDKTMAGLLPQLKGVTVELQTTNNRTLRGVVMGIEEKETVKDVTTITAEGHRVTKEERSQREFVTLLCEQGNPASTFIQAAELTDVNKLTVLDDLINSDVARLLELFRTSKKNNLKELVIHTKGQGSREIVTSYIVETPVWKATYKISLPANTEKPIRIIGSALVDNVQEDPWDNVKLSLVTGFPISFKYDLYAPQYRNRPYFTGPEEGTLNINLMFQIFSPPAPQYTLTEGHGFSKKVGRPSKGRSPAGRTEKKSQHNDLSKAGDFCKWDIKHPVTIASHGSALVPLLDSTVQGKRVAVFDPRIRKSNPMSAVHFKNTSGFQIEEGPAYIEEDGVYVGEVMLQNTQAGEEVLIPYAIDKGCTIVASEGPAVNQPKPHSLKGNITYYKNHVSVHQYDIYNNSNRSITLFIDHPLSPGTVLTDPNDPNLHELTEELARFKLELEPQFSCEFLVTENTERQAVSWATNSKKDFLEDLLAEEGVIPEKEYPNVQKILAMSKQIIELEDKYKDLSKKLERAQEREQKVLAQLKDLRETRETERHTISQEKLILTDTAEETALRSKLSTEVMELSETIKTLSEEKEAIQFSKIETEREREKIASDLTFAESNPSQHRTKKIVKRK